MARKKITAEQKDRRRRMKWWHEAKFGMFVVGVSNCCLAAYNTW